MATPRPDPEAAAAVSRGPIAPAPPSTGASPSPPGSRRWRSADLFGPTHEIEIEHGESVYRLRLTSLGKLILTK